MEDVLEVYHRPYDPTRPQVCVDETSKQLLEHTRVPVPAIPGTPVRVDDEYKRCGTGNIFAAVEPLTGRCLLEVTERRTAVDMAHYLRRLSDETYWSATVIVLVMDNLNIHDLSCLYEAFEPSEARRLVERFEVHHTPKCAFRRRRSPVSAHRDHPVRVIAIGAKRRAFLGSVVSVVIPRRGQLEG